MREELGSRRAFSLATSIDLFSAGEAWIMRVYSWFDFGGTVGFGIMAVLYLKEPIVSYLESVFPFGRPGGVDIVEDDMSVIRDVLAELKVCAIADRKEETLLLGRRDWIDQLQVEKLCAGCECLVVNFAFKTTSLSVD